MVENHLIDACLAIMRAGVKRSDSLDTPILHPKLVSIGNHVLNGSNLGRTFHLKPYDKGYKKNKEEVVIVFKPTMTFWFCLLDALDQDLLIKVVHVKYGSKIFMTEARVLDTMRAAWFCVRHNKPDRYVENPFRFDFNKVTTPSKDLEFHEIDVYKQLEAYPGYEVLEVAVASTLGSRVWYPVSKEDRSETINGRFFRETSKFLTDYYGYDVLVETPSSTADGHYSQCYKHSLFRGYRERGYLVDSLRACCDCEDVSFDVDNSTPFMQHCGVCFGCYKKFYLFQRLNLEHLFKTHPQSGPNYGIYAAKLEEAINGENRSQEDGTSIFT
jgi:hypothetical protein